MKRRKALPVAGKAFLYFCMLFLPAKLASKPFAQVYLQKKKKTGRKRNRAQPDTNTVPHIEAVKPVP